MATYFACIGYDVSVVCYSSALVDRDEKSFSKVFEIFEVKDYIKYSTILETCEDLFNDNGNKRAQVLEALGLPVGHYGNSNPSGGPNARLKVLLIDEVDVFFGPEFMGSTYNPVALFQHENINKILREILSKRNFVTKESITAFQPYKDLVQLYPDLRLVFEKEIEKMIEDVKYFDSPASEDEKYLINNGNVEYMKHGKRFTNKRFSYKTAFIALQNHQKANNFKHGLNICMI
ncbi:hypothetical protein M1146_07045 [Patescibacteria group bacterium]|nr:hypothetical protein [Patescibacteria group bacterium]